MEDLHHLGIDVGIPAWPIRGHPVGVECPFRQQRGHRAVLPPWGTGVSSGHRLCAHVPGQPGFRPQCRGQPEHNPGAGCRGDWAGPPGTRQVLQDLAGPSSEGFPHATPHGVAGHRSSVGNGLQGFALGLGSQPLGPENFRMARRPTPRQLGQVGPILVGDGEWGKTPFGRQGQNLPDGFDSPDHTGLNMSRIRESIY
jgi:hypothetical protein